MILEDPDDVDSDDPDELPESVKSAGFIYVIGMQDVQGIVANLKQQKNATSLDEEDYFEAFIYYLKNDAYKVVA